MAEEEHDSGPNSCSNGSPHKSGGLLEPQITVGAWEDINLVAMEQGLKMLAGEQARAAVRVKRKLEKETKKFHRGCN